MIKYQKVNICYNFQERTNRTLKENLIYKRSNFTNFRNSILETYIYFSNKKVYDLNNPSLSKSLVYYISNCNYLDAKNKKVKLIDLRKIKEI